MRRCYLRLLGWLSRGGQNGDDKGHKQGTKDHSWRSLGSAKGADGIGRRALPLFIVLVNGNKEYSIFYLPADLQQPSMFRGAHSAIIDRKKGRLEGVRL